jgi:hypothetical protein
VDNREERAFLHQIFPCNAFPFLKRMGAILRENHCNNYPSLPEAAKIDYRACLWVINGQVFGQIHTLDMGQEWQELSKYVDKAGLQAAVGG